MNAHVLQALFAGGEGIAWRHAILTLLGDGDWIEDLGGDWYFVRALPESSVKLTFLIAALSVITLHDLWMQSQFVEPIPYSEFQLFTWFAGRFAGTYADGIAMPGPPVT